MSQSTAMRLDNGHPIVLEAMRIFAYDIRFWTSHKYDENDPGRTPPIDVCETCWNIILYNNVPAEATDVAHPPYAEINAHCAICNQPLEEK